MLRLVNSLSRNSHVLIHKLRNTLVCYNKISLCINIKMLALKSKDMALKQKKKRELKSPKGVYQHVHSIISQNRLQPVILGYKLKP